MSDPQYGTQTVRFVETAQVADDKSISQFRVCRRVDKTSPTNPPTIESQDHVLAVRASNDSFPDTSLSMYGVTQQSLRKIENKDNPSEQNASDKLRLVPVATSGLLLVEQGENPLVAGKPLSIDKFGRATDNKDGTKDTTPAPAQLVTVNGTTPTVRSTVTYGKKHYALVSFT